MLAHRKAESFASWQVGANPKEMIPSGWSFF
jgi:hypothetical protein